MSGAGEGDSAKPRRRGLVEFLGIREHDPEPGRVRCGLTLDERHQNIQGVTHGSIPIALMDTAMGHALDGLLADDEFCSTTQLDVQFLAATRPGDVLEAEGVVTKKGRRIAYLTGTCTRADGEVVARAQGTWYIGTVRA